VVIDKLPFPVPTDPIVQARSELVGESAAFAEVSIPVAAVGLAQGAGRLLRTVTDRGVVVVLDSRLAEAGYRRRILDRLPPFRRTRDPEDVRRFVESLELDG
jgi:ATP-dependent DNA helicase DinG